MALLMVVTPVMAVKAQTERKMKVDSKLFTYSLWTFGFFKIGWNGVVWGRG